MFTLERQSTLDMAVDAIGNYIIENHLNTGAALPPETQLAEDMGISRNVMREAMRHYRTLGIIESKTKIGASVAKLLPDNPYKNYMLFLTAAKDELLPELIEARVSLETGASEAIVKKITDEEIDALEEIVEQMRKTGATLRKQLSALDQQFHAQLLQGTHNQFIIGMIPLLVNFFAKILPKFDKLQQKTDTTCLIEHEKIIAALRERDAEKLRATIRAHLDIYLPLEDKH